MNTEATNESEAPVKINNLPSWLMGIYRKYATPVAIVTPSINEGIQLSLGLEDVGWENQTLFKSCPASSTSVNTSTLAEGYEYRLLQVDADIQQACYMRLMMVDPTVPSPTLYSGDHNTLKFASGYLHKIRAMPGTYFTMMFTAAQTGAEFRVFYQRRKLA